MVNGSKILKGIRSNWLILSIVLLAFILRIWGVAYGLPGLFVGDEKSIVGGAMKMIYQKNIFPFLEPGVFRLLYYPTLIPWILLIFFIPWSAFVYLTGDFNSLSALRDYFTLNPEPFFLIARGVNVLFSTAAVFLVYAVGKKIFSYRAGLLAALIYAVSFLPIHQGHFVKHWNVGGFMALLVLYFSFLILTNQRWRNYILAGVFIGLAGFADYLHVLYSLILAYVHFFMVKLPLKEKLLSRKFWSGALLAVIIFSIGILTYPQEFYRLVFGEDSTVARAKTILGLFSVAKEILTTLFYSETIILSLAVIGCLFLFWKNRKLFFGLILIPILSPFLYYFLLHFEPRYILLFLPILGILAGFGLDQIIKVLKIKSIFLVALLCLAVIFIPLQNAVVFDMILSQADNRLLAKEWLEDNIPYGSKIIINAWEFNLIRSSRCIYDQQQTNNLSLRTRDYVMWSREFINSYCVWPLDLVLVLPKNIQEYQYYVTDEYTISRTNLDQDLRSHAFLVKEFSGSVFDITVNYSSVFVHRVLSDIRNHHVGPTVKIYQLDFSAKN